MALVVDASALVLAVLDPAARALRQQLVDEATHAPPLIDAELGNVLRRHVLRGHLEGDRAVALLAAGSALIDERHQMAGDLAVRAWALRMNATFYDALYAALAGTLDIPLLTADVRLASTPGLGCLVQLIDDETAHP